jgi:hypothetical protein
MSSKPICFAARDSEDRQGVAAMIRQLRGTVPRWGSLFTVRRLSLEIQTA